MDSTFFIVYPCGDTTKISVVELSQACLYEINDYSRASRKDFVDNEEAVAYATASSLFTCI